MRYFIIAAAPLALAACATNENYGAERTAEAQAEVAQRLAGYSPVGTRSCLPSRSSGQTQVYPDGTMLVKQGASLYQQNLGPGCADASSVHNTLVTDGTFGTLCSGTIARVIDSSTGIFHGSCAIGEWTEYKKAPGSDAG